MTLLLRSKVKASSWVDNVHGNRGPSDYVGMLDFMRGEYYTITGGQRTDYKLEEAVNYIRNSEAWFFDRNGIEHTVPANTPFIAYDSLSQMHGLAIQGRTTENMLQQGVDQESFTVSGGTTNAMVSLMYEGSGDADLQAAELSLHSTHSDGDVTIKQYTRSTSSSFAATLSLTGQVSRVCAIRDHVSSYVPPGRKREASWILLGAPFTSLVAGGTGSIFGRFVQYPYFKDITIGYGTFLTVRNSQNPYGGLYYMTSTSGQGVASVTFMDDDAEFNQYETTAQILDPYRADYVAGGLFGQFGKQIALVAGRQYAVDDDVDVSINQFDEVLVGSVAGARSGVGFLNVLLTHLVIYDRFLTEAEALALGSSWVN